VSVDRYKIYVYALSGLLSALAGMILISYIDGGVYTNGSGYDLNSIAAAIIGGTSLSGGTGGVWGTLIGVLIIRVVPAGMVMLNAPSEWRDIVTGIVILLAVLIDVERRRARKAAPKVSVTYSTATGHYLDEVLGRISQTVEEHLGCRDCRVYMVDRETNELLPQAVPGVQESRAASNRLGLAGETIVSEAREKGTYVYVPEAARGGDHRVVPLNPEIQSALAMPLSVRNRVVGVIEVQSSIPDGFRDDAILMLGNLCAQTAVMLEDAWLLDSGWLMSQTRDALRHLWDDLYLGRSPLAEWLLATPHLRMEPTRAARGEALRNQLLSAVEGLRPPPGETHEPSRTGRGRRVLQLTYLEERVVDEITRELHISRRQYFYDLKQAVQALTDTLVHMHQITAQPAAMEPQGRIPAGVLPRRS
jgi:GAF domain-containing protein